MISLLEKEARDPVEVLRIKLKDSTDTALLNSQLLQEVKHDYLRRQDDTKGQLDAFVQAHVDEIERASHLLEMEDTVLQVVANLEALGRNCRTMNEELGEKKLSSGISIARRNLKEVETQIVFYNELPAVANELNTTLDERLDEVVDVYIKWQALDDWRQKMLHELRISASDRTDELGNTRARARIMTAMTSRLDGIEQVHKKILAEMWGCMHHCVEIAQYNNKPRLIAAFEIMELMEKRRQRIIESKRDYLDNSLTPVGELHTPYNERCKTEIASFLTRKVTTSFRLAEKEALEKKKKPLDAVLDAANHLLMNLEIVQSDVVPCFPSDVDVMNVFTSTFNTILEGEISQQCSKPNVGIAERLQLVQWIEYYNDEIVQYKRARASTALEQTSQTLMGLYLDQIQEQINMWVTNVWRRDEELVFGPQGELQSTRPNDIINILKSQISIGQEWLTGRLVGRVVNQCLQTLIAQLKARHDSLAAKIEDTDVEALCAFINDTDILQSKCPELVEEISFAERDPEEKEAFDSFMGDGLDMASIEIVTLAVSTCDLIVSKIFAEVEQDTTRLWFSKKWDDGETVVENFLVTLADYFSDLTRWVSGSFFFSKIVRQCLDRCVSEYVKRILARTHCIANAHSAAATVESDLQHMVAFFVNYASELRRTGLRSSEAIAKEFTSLQMIIDALLEQSSQSTGMASGVATDHRQLVAHVRKLLRSSSNQESAVSSEKSKLALTKQKIKNTFKDKDKDNKKDNEKVKDKDKDKDKSKDKGRNKGKGMDRNEVSASKELSSRESSFVDTSAVDPDVQTLDMASFLGGS